MHAISGEDGARAHDAAGIGGAHQDALAAQIGDRLDIGFDRYHQMRLFRKQGGDDAQMAGGAAKCAFAGHRLRNHVAIGETGIHRARIDGAQIVGAALAGARRQDHAGRTAHRGGIATPHTQRMADKAGHRLANGKIDAFGGASSDLEGNAGRSAVIGQAHLAACHQRTHHQRHKDGQSDDGDDTLRHE